jgi:hypothetical protein
VIVHGIEIGNREPVKVTLTLFARVVSMGFEELPADDQTSTESTE